MIYTNVIHVCISDKHVLMCTHACVLELEGLPGSIPCTYQGFHVLYGLNQDILRVKEQGPVEVLVYFPVKIPCKFL